MINIVKELRDLSSGPSQEINSIGQRGADEIERLRAALREDRAAREFARWAIRNTAWQGGSLDGGDVQEMAEKLGIIERRTATVENKDQWQFIDYVAPGDWFYVLADWIKPDLARAALGGQHE